MGLRRSLEQSAFGRIQGLSFPASRALRSEFRVNSKLVIPGPAEASKRIQNLSFPAGRPGLNPGREGKGTQESEVGNDSDFRFPNPVSRYGKIDKAFDQTAQATISIVAQQFAFSASNQIRELSLCRLHDAILDIRSRRFEPNNPTRAIFRSGKIDKAF